MEFSGAADSLMKSADGRVLMVVTEVKGVPERGMCVKVRDRECRIVDIAKNANGEIVWDTACLGGWPTPLTIAVIIEWRGEELRRDEIKAARVELILQ